MLLREMKMRVKPLLHKKNKNKVKLKQISPLYSCFCVTLSTNYFVVSKILISMSVWGSNSHHRCTTFTPHIFSYFVLIWFVILGKRTSTPIHYRNSREHTLVKLRFYYPFWIYYFCNYVHFLSYVVHFVTPCNWGAWKIFGYYLIQKRCTKLPKKK